MIRFSWKNLRYDEPRRSLQINSKIPRGRERKEKKGTNLLVPFSREWIEEFENVDLRINYFSAGCLAADYFCCLQLLL